MIVQFRDDNQRNRYAVLSERPMLSTRYPNSTCMKDLGIEKNIHYLCNQIEWDEYAEDKHVTYRNLTLEFLISLIYDPSPGRGFHSSQISFRLFRHEYKLIH